LYVFSCKTPSTPERKSDVARIPIPIAYVCASAARSWSVLAEEGGTGLESVATITPRETSRTEIWPVTVSQLVQKKEREKYCVNIGDQNTLDSILCKSDAKFGVLWEDP
jgi:hypothetical protein